VPASATTHDRATTVPCRANRQPGRANRQPTVPTATTTGAASPTGSRHRIACNRPPSVHHPDSDPWHRPGSATTGTAQATPGLSTTHRASHPADRGLPRSTRLDATCTVTYLPSAPTLSARLPRSSSTQIAAELVGTCSATYLAALPSTTRLATLGDGPRGGWSAQDGQHPPTPPTRVVVEPTDR